MYSEVFFPGLGYGGASGTGTLLRLEADYGALVANGPTMAGVSYGYVPTAQGSNNAISSGGLSIFLNDASLLGLLFGGDSDQIARIGGEEFAILLIRADRELALSIAERLRTRIDDLILEEDPPLPVDLTASLGVAFFREDGDDPKSLLRSADRALYAAKRLGRNRVVLASEAAAAEDQSVG